MSLFKAGIITEDGKVTLTPIGSKVQTHTALLHKMGIYDSDRNERRAYVKATLIPPGNRITDVSEWEYCVNQRDVPNWYWDAPLRYERLFREAVRHYVEETYTIMCGHAWQKIKREGDKTYFLYAGTLGEMAFSHFKENNYALSDVREFLLESRLLHDMEREYGDRLLPISLNLTSIYGGTDYGKLEGDKLSLLTYDLFKELQDKIDSTNRKWWIATPYMIGLEKSLAANPRWNDSPYTDEPVLYRCICIDYLDVRPFCMIRGEK